MFAIMQTMGERLRAAREAANYSSAAKAAEALGVSASSYRAHENGQNDFGPELAERYARKFGTTAAYLLTAEGPSRVARGPRLVSTYDPDAEDEIVTERVEGGGAVFGEVNGRLNWKPKLAGAIPEIDVRLGAGEGMVGEIITLPLADERYSGHRVIAEWLIPEDYLRNEIKSSPKTTVIEEIYGDSMSPTYAPGDRVLVDLLQNTMKADAVYSISDGIGEPQIKRLQRVPFSDPPQVIIISDNPTLERFTVELSKLFILGRVVGRMSRQ